MDPAGKKSFVYQVAELSDGTFAAISNQTPGFCLVREAEEEAKAAGRSAIDSYLRLFGSGETISRQEGRPMRVISARTRSIQRAEFEAA